MLWVSVCCRRPAERRRTTAATDFRARFHYQGGNSPAGRACRGVRPIAEFQAVECPLRGSLRLKKAVHRHFPGCDRCDAHTGAGLAAIFPFLVLQFEVVNQQLPDRAAWLLVRFFPANRHIGAVGIAATCRPWDFPRSRPCPPPAGGALEQGEGSQQAFRHEESLRMKSKRLASSE